MISASSHDPFDDGPEDEDDDRDCAISAKGDPLPARTFVHTHEESWAGDCGIPPWQAELWEGKSPTNVSAPHLNGRDNE